MNKLLKRFYNSIQTDTNQSERQITAFGTIMFVNYPLYYMIWLYASYQTYESLTLRLTASCFCLFLLLKKLWSRELYQRIFPIYWFLTVSYCLPFFFTFMTLQNHGSAMWLMNCVSVMFFVLLLFNMANALIALFIGILAGFCFYKVFATTPFTFEVGIVNFSGVSATLFAALLIGAIFARNKEKIEQEKLLAMRSIGTNIAHELRTPLAAINMTADGVKEYWPHLIDGYNLAKQHELPVHPLRTSQFNIIQSSVDDILAEAHYANSIINMLLLKANEFTITARELKNYAIAECINEALRRYPFAEGEKKLVHWNAKIDFVFKGNELFMIHVLFNLLKNALYYIHAARKGEVYITLEKGQSINKLIFRDTGSGIPAKYMKHLFDRFFSKTHGGTGLGLTFAKMVMQGFGGDIICRSKEGEFTEFTLSFPVLPEAELNLE